MSIMSESLKQETVKLESLSSLQIDPGRVAGWTVGVLLSLLLFGMIFGSRYPGVLDAIGLEWLHHEEAGVYADCSKAYNANNPYCAVRKEDHGWRDLKDTKGAPSGFTLH